MIFFKKFQSRLKNNLVSLTLGLNYNIATKDYIPAPVHRDFFSF